jgi:hypothetical protein
MTYTVRKKAPFIAPGISGNKDEFCFPGVVSVRYQQADLFLLLYYTHPESIPPPPGHDKLMKPPRLVMSTGREGPSTKVSGSPGTL